MIIPLNVERDITAVMNLWLTANQDAHPYLPDGYWESNYDMVAELLPQSDLQVFWKDDKPVGFIGVMDGYIAGIFVDKEYRGQKVGHALLEYAKENYSKLTLDVYEKNKKAYDFYLYHNFRETERKQEEHGLVECKMEWVKETEERDW